MTASWAFQPSCIPSTSRGTVKEQFPDLFESLHSLEECVIKIIIKGKYKVFKIIKFLKLQSPKPSDGHILFCSLEMFVLELHK